MVSDAATATDSFLRAVPNSVTCEQCVATYLGVDRYDALKSIRELIHAGRILCTYGECTFCHERRLLAQVRSAPPRSLIE
jgi:hypothetical protein